MAPLGGSQAKACCSVADSVAVLERAEGRQRDRTAIDSLNVADAIRNVSQWVTNVHLFAVHTVEVFDAAPPHPSKGKLDHTIVGATFIARNFKSPTRSALQTVLIGGLASTAAFLIARAIS